jgi:hypothetical protein
MLNHGDCRMSCLGSAAYHGSHITRNAQPCSECCCVMTLRTCAGPCQGGGLSCAALRALYCVDVTSINSSTHCSRACSQAIDFL